MLLIFPACLCSLFRFSLQDRSQLRTLRVGMEKFKNIDKRGRIVNCRRRPFLKPRRPMLSKRSVRTFDALPKSHKNAQGIVHNGIIRGHTTVFDTGHHKSMIGRYGWEIIKRHDTWIDTLGVNMGGTPRSGRRLKMVDAKGVVKKRLDGKGYLVILGQAFFNKNSDETLLAEDQIECYGVKVYSHPRVFGGKQLVEAQDQVGRSIKIGISWDGSNRYLDITTPY